MLSCSLNISDFKRNAKEEKKLYRRLVVNLSLRSNWGELGPIG